jgi:methylmalonyl-CoA mutase N-terminal domain/subunit
VKTFKQKRDNGSVKRKLAAIVAAATDKTNLMPPIIDAVKAKATLGEICDVLRKEFGEWREPPIYW